MRNLLEHDNDEDRLSVVRATAIALGLPLLVLETVERLDSMESDDQASGASPRALVLLMRRPRRPTTSPAGARMAVEPGAGIAAQVSALRSSHGVSGEGGIVRFNIGDRRKELAAENARRL